VPLHCLIGIVGDKGIPADLLETVAYKGKGFIERTVLQLIDELYPFLVIKVASYPVERISGVSDEASALEDITDAPDKPLLRVIRVYGNE